MEEYSGITATNNAFAKYGLDIENIGICNVASSVWADVFQFSFSPYLELYIFNLAFVPAENSYEYPYFANASPLAASIKYIRD